MILIRFISYKFILGDQSHSAQQRRSNTMLSVKRLLNFASNLDPIIGSSHGTVPHTHLSAKADDANKDNSSRQGFNETILTRIFHASN